MKTILSLGVFLVVFAFSEASYPELSEGNIPEAERVRKFTEEEAVKETLFWLYTLKNKGAKEGQELKINDTTLLENSYFNVTRPVRFLIHGFLTKKDSEYNTKLTKAYLAKGNFNVIVVDWGALSKEGFGALTYGIVAESVKHISDIVADFAKFLNRMGVPFENMYLIGHSLGAHIAGMAGQKVKPHQFHVIFGLDPAGPSFSDKAIDDRLDKGDAYYVETIHTNIKLPRQWSVTYGYTGALGNASFFPNFGGDQPGCDDSICSHSRAYEYFAESLEDKKPFYGRGCISFDEIKYRKCTGSERRVIMGGEPAHTDREGIYYVETADHYPYRVDQLDPADYIDMSSYPSKLGSTQATRILICDNSEEEDSTGIEDCEKLKKAYATKNVNVVLVNWSRAVKSLENKDFTVENIGHAFADKLKKLHEEGVPYDQMYLVGVQKGVIVASEAAKGIAPEKINTLFALDYELPFDNSGFKYVESISRFGKYGGTNVILRDWMKKPVDAFIETLTEKNKNMGIVCKTLDMAQYFYWSNDMMPFGGEPSCQNQPRAKFLAKERDS